MLQRFSHRLVNRLLHSPSIRLRQAAERADDELLAAARYFFLDHHDEPGNTPASCRSQRTL